VKRSFARRKQHRDGGDGESGARDTELDKMDVGVNVDKWGLSLRGRLEGLD
jgi:hypothetical protein